MVGVDERHVETRLAQQGEGPEDLEPVLLHVAQEPEDLLALPVEVGLVELLVPGVEIELEDLLLLLGQVGDDLLLGPAQDDRSDTPA